MIKNKKQVSLSGVELFMVFIPFLFSLTGCSDNLDRDKPYIDPHVIFTSRRWWNYDIFIADIYGGHVTHLTKNKWLDFNPSISSDGKKLSFVSDRDGNREIYSVDLFWMDGYTQWEGRNLKNLTHSPGHDWTPKYSPNGDRIVFTTYFPETDNYDVFVMDSDGSNKRNLTNSTWYEKLPQFSPDGSYIIYQAWQKGKMEIFFLNLLEEVAINLTRNTMSHDIISEGNSFSPDGEKIIFTSERDGNKEIYIMNSDGTNQKRLTENDADDWEPVFSPWSNNILFTSNRDGNKEIYGMDSEGRNIVNLSNNSADDWSPRFYPDGRRIVHLSVRDGNWEIYMMKLDGSRQTNLSNHPRTDYSFVLLPRAE